MSLNKAAPSLARIHAGYPEAPEECSRILEHMFADSVLSFRSWVPEYSAWLAAHESEPKYYQEFQNILGLLGMDDNHQHWICKAPRHMLALASLIEVFPNCRVIWTHRDPTQVVPSLCSLATTTLALTSEHPAPKELGAGLLHRIASGLEKAIKFRTSDQQDRYVDVHYRDLMSEPIAVVKNIYDHHGLPFTSEFEVQMQHWLTEYPQDKHGRHTYSAEAIGLTNQQITERFTGLVPTRLESPRHHQA